MFNKRGVSKIIPIALVIALLIAIYFTFFFSYKCDDMECYQAHQQKCSKTEFIRDSDDVRWQYDIKGNNGGLCEIEVTALLIKKGDADKTRLEGKSMTCYLPLESIALPEADISKCNGVLKEELQNIIIKNLHSYILDNLGEISEELQKVV